MKKRCFLISLGILLLIPVVSLAVPAYPGLITMKQPGGEEISVYLKGDEKVHWMESSDGYSLLYDEDKRIVFAISDESGNMIPSSIVFQNSQLRSSALNKQLADIPKRLRYSVSQVSTLKEIWNFTNRSIENASLRATTGTVRALCALVRFPDKPLTKTKGEFEQLLNQVGYSLDGARGSVHDFYYENSYGKLTLIVTVTDTYTAGHELSYYGAPSGDYSDNYTHIAELAKSVAKDAFSQAGINPADYDNDNDGYIDAFHFIYAGYGEEAGGGVNAIWAHESGFSAINIGGGKKLDVYSCSPELRGNAGMGITRIGVVCHEMGHVFGAPDFYDTDGEAGGDFLGTGQWDLMAGGSWNGTNGDGRGASPAHINMYQKIKLGWIDQLVTLDAPRTVTDMPNSAKNSVAYTYDTSVPGEYYVLENRQKTGFDSFVPGSGLLIYHVSVGNRDISSNRVNATHPQKMYPVCASSTYKVPDTRPISYGSINSAACPFPGTSGKTSFTDYTTPSAITWQGVYSAKPITEISEQNGIISFKFMQPGSESVANFTLTKNGANVLLKWDKPNNNVLGYNIYCNDLFIIKLMGASSTSYTQNNVSPGNYTYCVTAYYEQDESAQSCQNMNIEGNPNEYLPISNLNAAISGSAVELTWDSPAKSDWVYLTENPYNATYYQTNNFSSVVRFTEDDLKSFVGSKLSQVRFYVQNVNCKHTIQVWHFPTNSMPELNPIVKQEVATIPEGIHDVDLNDPLTVEAGKELWIGVNYQMNPMTHVAVKDRGPKAPDKNFVIYDGQWKDLNVNDDFNWYIAGYLKFDSNLNGGSPNLPDKYSVYCDNVWQRDVTKGYFKDDIVPNGYHIYCVSAVYGSIESERICIQTPVRTGIADLNPAADMKAYPNPIKQGDILTMDLGNDFANTKLSFYSVSGQLLLETTVSEPVYYQKIDFSPGIYILQIRKNTQFISRKIVVK